MCRKVEKVDQTMDSIREQMDLTNEISDAISNPVGMGNMVDEVSNELTLVGGHGIDVWDRTS